MKKFLLVQALFLHIFCFGQTPSTQHSPPLEEAPPASVGVSAERLDRIDRMCQDAVDAGQIPGIVALVARRGKIVFHKAYGMSDNTTQRTLMPDDIFRIASQTKAITATAVMMLWEEGKFQLDDPISKFIPEFEKPEVLNSFRYADTSYTTVPADREITVRHLLTHTSGLGYGVIDGDERMKMIYAKAGITDLFTTEAITIGESVKKLAALPLHHHPGEKWTYSEGLDVLGYFIEIISGMTFAEFLETRLFQPLGMTDTYFYLPASKASRLVTVQKPDGDNWVKYPVTFYDPDYPIKGAKKFYSGGAGLCSTAKDYAIFLQMYLNEGELNGIRILSRTTIQSMMANQIGDLWDGWGGGSDYGLAFGLVNEEGEALGGRGSKGTFDWGGYFNTQYFADPREEIIGVIMKQTQNSFRDQTGWKFRLLVGQSIDD